MSAMGMLGIACDCLFHPTSSLHLRPSSFPQGNKAMLVSLSLPSDFPSSLSFIVPSRKQGQDLMIVGVYMTLLGGVEY